MVVVMVGRNIGTAPMPLARWHRFQHEAANALRTVGEVMTRATGRYAGNGRWSAEDTALYVVDTALGTDAVQRALQDVLRRYEQDAAGVIQGTLQEV